ncbi:MAG: DUF4876 domain-containing protein [Bacteroidales bacterium]|nr:DUF4876 domain-containing protein [Bacteroidales bacterium]
MRRLILPLFALLLITTSCLEEIDTKATLKIKISAPQGNIAVEGLDLTEIEVKLQNKSNAFSYSNHLDNNGEVVFVVQPGKYDVLASAQYNTGVSVNASKSEFLLTEDGIIGDDGSVNVAEILLELNVNIPNPLIIREIYYHGSSTLEGKSYSKDRYIEIYNNGLITQYLDSLCITTIFPYNSTTGSNSWADKDTIPAAGMVWMIPGNGTQYPLAPGESCVLAYCAVDHTQRATSGLNLAKAHFGFYEDGLTGHEIAAGVPPLIRIVAGLGSAWSFSISSPAVIIFRPEMGVANYLANAATWELFEPGKTSGTKYWHIAKEWILDGVECVQSAAKSIKRLPTSVDASYIYMNSASYSGKVVTRKVKEIINGNEVFQDTNNSAEDFISDQVPSPRLKN